jgi:hypothetical protein
VVKAKAMRMLTEANIPETLLNASDLISTGTDEAAWKRTIARTRAAIEGGSSFSFGSLMEKDQVNATPAQESFDTLASSMEAAGLPVKQK